MAEKVVKQRQDRELEEKPVLVKVSEITTVFSKEVEELAKRTGMQPRKLTIAEEFCRRMEIEKYDAITGSVASGIFDRKGNVDIVIVKGNAEASKMLSSWDFMMFGNGQIIRFPSKDEKCEGIITDYDEAGKYATGEKRQREPLLVDFGLRDRLDGHKISVFEVREDVDPWLAVPNAPSPPFQPFGTIMLTTSQPLTEKTTGLVGRLSTEFDIKQVSDAYFAIAGQLLNVNHPSLKERGMNIWHNEALDNDVAFWMANEKGDKAAKTMFRAFGDLLPRALFMKFTGEWPTGKTMEQMVSVIDKKLPGIGDELTALTQASIELRENPDNKEILELWNYAIDTYNAICKELNLDLETLNKNAKEFNEKIIRDTSL